MRARGHFAIATCALATTTLTAFACSQKSAAVGLTMYAPQGLLDTASKVELTVIEEGENLRCRKATGEVSGTYDKDLALRFDLGRSDCAPGASWCKDITVEQSSSEKIFEIRATGAGEEIARGCAAVVIEQDPQVVEIDVLPIVEPACCNDGTVQLGEQCDSGAIAQTDCAGAPTNNAACSAILDDLVCHCDCLAKEIVLSSPGLMPALDNNPGTKFDPALAFAGGAAGGDIPNSLRAVFTDTSGGTGENINQRVLDANLMPAPGVLAQQLHLPQDCETMTSPDGPIYTQREPDIARVSDGLLAVVFADDRAVPGTFDVRLVAQNAWACNDTSPPSVAGCPGCMTIPCPNCLPTKLNVSPGIAFPAVASAVADQALVVWLSGTSVKGRLWLSGADSDCSTCQPTDAEIDFGITGAVGRPRVTGNAMTGYVIAYSAANNVYVRTVSADAATISPEIKVNITAGVHDQPAVASLADGRFVVVWRNEARLLFQRFDAAAAPIAGDQDQPLSASSPAPYFDPQVASSGGTGSFFAATWASGNQTIWARFIDAEGGFLRNHVTGGLDDFPVLHPATVGAQPQTPDVAIGDSGFVAIGWADLGVNGAEGRGIRVRRFPLPIE
jgi:hypothetical protein